MLNLGICCRDVSKKVFSLLDQILDAAFPLIDIHLMLGLELFLSLLERQLLGPTVFLLNIYLVLQEHDLLSKQSLPVLELMMLSHEIVVSICEKHIFSLEDAFLFLGSGRKSIDLRIKPLNLFSLL